MKIQETNILFLIVCDKQKTVIFQNNSTQTKHITNLFVAFFKKETMITKKFRGQLLDFMGLVLCLKSSVTN